MNSLTIIPQVLPLAELKDPDATASFILWLGLQDRPNLPERKDAESDRDYTERVFRHIKRRDKSEIIVAGLNKAAIYRQALSDGIQLVCYRAWVNGWWVDTQDSGGTEAAFRAWVKDAVTAEDGSTTEAYQLASTILNLFWLKENGYQGLPKDLEEIFRDRALYSRWRRKASEIKGYIEAINDWEEPEQEDDEEEPEESGLDKLETYLQRAIEDINNPEKGTDDLDKRVGQQEAPPVIMELTGYDDLGRSVFEGRATLTQLHRLRRATRDCAEWRLKGEAYGVTESFVLVRYRCLQRKACPKCGQLWGQTYSTCSWCADEPLVDAGNLWACQAWSNELGWSDFEECEEPYLNGNQEGVPLVDTELGLTYIAQWEEL